MMQPMAVGIRPSTPQNPKSILSNNNSSPSARPNPFANNNSTRVTFANHTIVKKPDDSATNLSPTYQAPPLLGSANFARPSSAPPYKPPSKYQSYFTVPQKQTAASTTGGKSSDHQLLKRTSSRSKALSIKGKSTSTLFTPKKTAKNVKSSIIALVEKSRSAGVPVTGRAAALARAKSSKSLLSTGTHRTRTGKKLKKRKKSKDKKDSESDSDDDNIEPAVKPPSKLNAEYTSELHKITAILKAVSAFDEANGTNNSSVTNSGPSGNNLVTNYRYKDTSRFSIASNKSLTNNASSISRPLSGGELKQLLSSITRVVSLHQLPLDPNPVPPRTPPTAREHQPGTSSTFTPPPPSPVSAVKYTNLAGVTTVLPTSVDGYRPTLESILLSPTSGATTTSKKNKDPSYDSDDSDSRSPRKKGKRKRSRKLATKAQSPSLSEIRKTIPEVRKLGGRPSGTRATFSSLLRSNPFLQRKSNKLKLKTRKRLSPASQRTQSKDSISDSEKDPVKHAHFLKKYYEESTRLANKTSSQELREGIDGDDDSDTKLQDKKKSKKRKKVSSSRK